MCSLYYTQHNDIIMIENKIESKGCSLCGCIGIHACMGQSEDWTPEAIKQFNDILEEYEAEDNTHE